MAIISRLPHYLLCINAASPLFPSFLSFILLPFFRSTIGFTPSLSPARMRDRFARSFSVAFSTSACPYQLFSHSLSLFSSLFHILFFRIARACRRLTKLGIISRIAGLHARANLESACRDCGKSVGVYSLRRVSTFLSGRHETRVSRSESTHFSLAQP